MRSGASKGAPRTRRARAALATLVIAGVTLLGAGSAPAETFPGGDGLLAWATGEFGDLVVANPDGSGQRVLDDAATLPAWSADGSRLAYTCPGTVAIEICVINADGTGRVQITDDDYENYAPTWTPDGRIVFVSNRDGVSALIYVMNDDGSDITPITSGGPNVDDFQPSVSPDGTRVAFSRNNGGDVEIWIVGIDGSSPTQLTDFAGSAGLPNWMPDGSRIVFSAIDVVQQIYSMNPDGTDVQPLTSGDDDSFEPAPSPTGTRIAFERQPSGGSVELFVMNADGTGAVGTGVTDVEGVSWQPVLAPPPAPIVLEPTFTG